MNAMNHSLTGDREKVEELAARYEAYGNAISGAGEIAFLARRMVKQLKLMEQHYATKERQESGGDQSQHPGGGGGGEAA